MAFFVFRQAPSSVSWWQSPTATTPAPRLGVDESDGSSASRNSTGPWVPGLKGREAIHCASHGIRHSLVQQQFSRHLQKTRNTTRQEHWRLYCACSFDKSSHAGNYLTSHVRISCRFFSRLQNDTFCNFLTGTDAALKHSKVYTKHRCTSHANAKSAGISAQRVGRCRKHYACFQTDRPHPATPFDTSPIPRLPRKIRLSRFIAHATAFWMSL